MSQELIDAMRAAEAALERNARTDLPYGVQEGSPPIAPWPVKSCKIVFLDFDGVLNSKRSIKRLGTPYRFAHENVEALNEVLKSSDTRIVVTSSWREIWTLKEFASFLNRDGVVPDRVVGKTSVLNGERGMEIDVWLRSVPYAVDSFVILDDKDNLGIHRNRLVKTDEELGLTLADAKRAGELLLIPRHK